MMEHWHAVLPGRVLDVQYESVVADQDGQTRRMLEFCGLPWEDACLRFYETQRAVRTASSEQVRRPIYASSVGFWRNYDAGARAPDRGTRAGPVVVAGGPATLARRSAPETDPAVGSERRVTAMGTWSILRPCLSARREGVRMRSQSTPGCVLPCRKRVSAILAGSSYAPHCRRTAQAAPRGNHRHRAQARGEPPERPQESRHLPAADRAGP